MGWGGDGRGVGPPKAQMVFLNLFVAGPFEDFLRPARYISFFYG